PSAQLRRAGRLKSAVPEERTLSQTGVQHSPLFGTAEFIRQSSLQGCRGWVLGPPNSFGRAACKAAGVGFWARRIHSAKQPARLPGFHPHPHPSAQLRCAGRLKSAVPEERTVSQTGVQHSPLFGTADVIGFWDPHLPCRLQQHPPYIPQQLAQSAGEACRCRAVDRSVIVGQ
ncbi:hypothetical protein SAMN05216217_11292, partial [Halopseudomonas yangmingensis]